MYQTAPESQCKTQNRPSFFLKSFNTLKLLLQKAHSNEVNDLPYTTPAGGIYTRPSTTITTTQCLNSGLDHPNNLKTTIAYTLITLKWGKFGWVVCGRGVRWRNTQFRKDNLAYDDDAPTKWRCQTFFIRHEICACYERITRYLYV